MGNLTEFMKNVKPRPAPEAPEKQLIDAMVQAGIDTPPQEVFFDGQLHRFSSGTKGHGRGGDKAGWYIAFSDGIPAGTFGCWRAGIECNWRADTGRDYTPAEEMAHAKRMAEAKAKRDAAKKAEQDKSSETVTEIWERAGIASPDHPYLRKKGINPNGARIAQDGRLITPLCDSDGAIKSIQYIDHTGKKLYHKGGATKGFYYQIGAIENSDRIYIGEGFATAATIHEATNKPCIAAYSASNLIPVTEKIKQLYPDIKIIIVADHDKHGVGQESAEKAAQLYGAQVVLPPIQGMDANDFAQSGHDLLLLLEPKIDDWLVGADDFCAQPAPIQWLVKHWLQQHALIMAHGPSGGGKTFFILDICLRIASGGGEWFGKKVNSGGVVYLAGEGHHGLKSRVAAWKAHYKPEKPLSMWLSKSGCDLNTPTGFSRVTEQINRLPQPPVLIVVDTLHRFLDGDENSSVDTKTMLDACSGLMEKYGCSVVLVHHTGVSEEAQHRARGSSAWRGALENEISITPTKDKGIKITQKKAKDSELQEPLYAQLTTIDVPGWFDEDGDQVQSAIIEQGEKPAEVKIDTKLQKHKKLFEQAWHASGGETLGEKPYLTRSAFIRFLVIEQGMTEGTAKNYSKPSAQGKPINELLLAKAISAEVNGWVVEDKIMVGAMVLSSTNNKR